MGIMGPGWNIVSDGALIEHDLTQARPAPLKVLTFLNSFAPGGVERVAARLHAAWTAGGLDARIVLADARIAPPMPLRNVSQALRRPYGGGLARAAALLRALPATIAGQRTDVLFCAGNTYALVAVMLKLVLGAACPPIVVKISNDLVRADMPPPMRVAYHAWLRIQGRLLDHFIGLAPAMRDEIAWLTGVAEARISIIEDPALALADLTRLATARDATPRAGTGRHFLAIGRLVPQKNFALLLEAFARMAGPEDRLTILGDGAERASLTAQAERGGVATQVSLPGHVDPIDPWLAQADALVMSSDYEGVPAVLIEALAAGVPIIATDCCVSMGDLLGHGALGTLVPVRDPAALAAAMAAIGDDDPAVTTARRAAATRFTVEYAHHAYVAVMRRLAAARAAATPQRKTRLSRING